MRFHGLRLPILAVLILLGSLYTPPGEAWAEEAGSGRAALPSGAPSMSMEQWREARESSEAAMEAPRGDEKIASLEKFVTEHPDYPYLETVLYSLVDAYVDKGVFDPAHLASLIERMAATENL